MGLTDNFTHRLLRYLNNKKKTLSLVFKKYIQFIYDFHYIFLCWMLSTYPKIVPIAFGSIGDGLAMAT